MWKIYGNGNSVILGVSESGCLRISGGPSCHEVYTPSYHNPTRKNEDQLKKLHEEKARFNKDLSDLELCWSIHPGNATESDISPADLCEPTLYERYQADPEINHVFINFYNNTDEAESPLKDRIISLGVSIVLPPETFNKVWGLFDRILTEPRLNYGITIGLRFWMSERRDDLDDLTGKYKDSWITMKEFSSGKSYYSNEINFWVFHEEDRIEGKEIVGEQDTRLLTENPMTQQELQPLLSTIKRSLRWITFLLFIIAVTLILK